MTVTPCYLADDASQGPRPLCSPIWTNGEKLSELTSCENFKAFEDFAFSVHKKPWSLTNNCSGLSHCQLFLSQLSFVNAFAFYFLVIK
jgi:hypothetical protein